MRFKRTFSFALLLLSSCHIPTQPWDRVTFDLKTERRETGFVAAQPIGACGKREAETDVLLKLRCDDRRAGEEHPVFLNARHAAQAYRGVREQAVLIYEARCEEKTIPVYVDISKCSGDAPDGDADFEGQAKLVRPATPAPRSEETPHD